MTENDLPYRLAVALAIGLLVGLERGWQSRAETDERRAAGLRTFALTGLLGGLSGVLAQETAASVLGLMFAAFAVTFAAFHWLEARAEQDFSVTGVVAGMLTFALGAYAVLGDDLRVAIAGAVAATILLALREPLHAWVRTLTWAEIRAVLVLLAMSFLFLPLLPNRPVDPWNALNPAEIWLMAIFVAGVSFAGYVAVRVLGDRAGIALASVAGGLASSTATTVTLARLAREHREATALLAGGVLMSGSVSICRVLLVVSALNGRLLVPLLAPFATVGVLLFGAGALLLRRRGGAAGEHPAIVMRNPFELATALRLAGFITVVLLLANILSARLGEGSVLVLAAVSGLADVDAVTLSMARLAETQIALETGAAAIGVAVAMNTAAKAVMAGVIGGPRFGLIVAGVGLVALVSGAFAYLTVHAHAW